MQAQAQATEAQINSLQRQISALEKQVKTLKQQPVPVKAQKAAAPVPFLKMPGNRPTFCTADESTCIAVTGRLHLDVGGYSYNPNTAATAPQDLRNGVNARRARIGLLGTFARNWDFGVVIDGGGSQDGTATLNNAYVAYKGIKGLVIEGGYMDVPYTLDEATSSNNITFMERATPQVLAADIGAGDNRAAFGARAFDKWWWAGAYLTGPTTGYDHSTRVPYGMTARAVAVPFNNSNGALLIGGDFLYQFDTGGAPNVNQLRLRDRPEIRIDPTRILDTGAINDVDHARVLSAELAASFGAFYVQGEYFDYNIGRRALADLHFNGGYVQASYVLTGESRKYSTSSGSFGGIKPNNPFTPGGGWGAWEIAARYSTVNLNDANVFGGKQSNLTVGLNWYVNENMRFMLNWVNGRVEKRNVAGADTGAKYNAIAMRAQVAF
jgi:phosphate-selective porin OprO/OprP